MAIIFDLGMHTGEDTAYYLARGYQVVALEANPALIEAAARRFADDVQRGTLQLVGAALSSEVGRMPFFVSSKNSEWSSLERWRAANQGAVTEIEVATTTLASLVREYGEPTYIKCDIEGADVVFCRQLCQLPRIPRFVSVEGICLEWLALLCAAGYQRFQLSNQAFIRRFCPSIEFKVNEEARSWKFTGQSSGPFGDDLPKDAWLSFDEVARRWLDFQRLKSLDSTMVLDNWFDFHAMA